VSPRIIIGIVAFATLLFIAALGLLVSSFFGTASGAVVGVLIGVLVGC
jgi:hypothetical protein